ncbi:hypothetical protein [Burkholderia cepacia]|uniref:hypothetical protein n=1 Tax=Burkholderia cepacia TaxID=292 RepID=UPI000F5EB90D|nr:hypothetical protein [Burkholderia cepacia]RRA01126.1 hypothetical protein DF055_21875 [Burkholderia cepacia]RRA04459.1 hypothetical protein DF054_23790 [Burkholderia cepacia]
MAKLRCRPGDLARVVRSSNPALVRRIVIVERLHDGECWETTVLGDPVFGVTTCDKRPIVTNDYVFRDSSLLPLRGDDHEIKAIEQEVHHG